MAGVTCMSEEQEELAGQQETVPLGMPNIVHGNVWTTFLIRAVRAESTILFYTW